MATAKKTTKETLVAVSVQPQAVQSSSAEALISQAISSNVPVETLERLLAMRTQIKQEQAKESFNRAMAKFQAECPTIVKTKEVRTRSGIVAYKYAPIESIVSQVKEPLNDNGFSYKTQVDITDTGVKATVRVTHVDGHSDDTSMEVPLGTKTDIMSHSQVTAAASTFAKRYAFCNAFGILTGDEDNDGAKFDKSEVADDVVPTVTYDDHEAPKKEPTELQKKDLIKRLADKKSEVPLLVKSDYEAYVLKATGLELESENLDLIVERLKA